MLAQNRGDSGRTTSVSRHADVDGMAANMAYRRQECCSHPSTIHAKPAAKMEPTIQNQATAVSMLPRLCTGRYSANSVNTLGTEPPTPMPAMTRNTTNHHQWGANADANPNTALSAREYRRHGLRPILSPRTPHTTPPTSMPTNTAALSTAFSLSPTSDRFGMMYLRTTTWVNQSALTHMVLCFALRLTHPMDSSSTASEAFPRPHIPAAT